MSVHPRIAIIGGTIWGNRGSEAMLVTTIGRIREKQPSSEFFVFSYYPEVDRELVKDNKIQIMNGKPFALVFEHFLGSILGTIIMKMGFEIPDTKYFKISRALKNSDILLDIGGITFSDGREKYLPFNILIIWPAMILGVPVIKLAQAIGPFNHWLNRLSAKFFLSRCKHIFARGEKTANFISKLGYPANKFNTVADIAFIYKRKYSLSKENNNSVSSLIECIGKVKTHGKNIIVFSPSILVDSKSQKKGLCYTDQFLSAIQQLGGKDFQYIFMPNATREGSEKKHNNDLLLINKIKSIVENRNFSKEICESINYVDYDINTLSIRRIVSSADVLITSRFHAMISGLVLGVPTIVIGWGHKYLETMELYDMKKFALDFSNQNLNLGKMISKTLSQKEQIRETLNLRKGAVLKLAEKQFIYLDDVLI